MDDVMVEELAEASVVDKGTSSPAHSWLREEALPILTSSLEQEPAGDRAGPLMKQQGPLTNQADSPLTKRRVGNPL